MPGQDDTHVTNEPWIAVEQTLRAGLQHVFHALAGRTALPEAALRRRSSLNAWSALETLEHVALTDRYLLLLASKIAERALARATRGERWPVHGPRLEHLQHLAGRGLEWSAPAHMIPSGNWSPAEVGAQLTEDLRSALGLLDAAPGGVGTLHRIRMSVVGGDDDRLDLYQYLEVVRLHALRHLAQVDRALAAAARG